MTQTFNRLKDAASDSDDFVCWANCNTVKKRYTKEMSREKMVKNGRMKN